MIYLGYLYSIRKKFKSGDFQLLNKRNINIYNLINKFNSNNNIK